MFEAKVILWIWYSLLVIGSLTAIAKAETTRQASLQLIVSGLMMAVMGWAIINA